MLSNIIQHVSEVVGVQPTDANKRAQLLRWINRAAKEVYDSGDLPGSVVDGVFAFTDERTQQVSLPWRVGDIRACRWPSHGRKVSLQSIHTSYNELPWTSDPTTTWHILCKTPLERSLSDASLLEFSIAVPETTPIAITVVGQTTNSSRVNETISIAPGETTVQTVNQFIQDDPIGIEAIQKDRITQSDVIVHTIVDSTRVASIPNRAYEAENTLIRISDFEDVQLLDAGIQVLYKKRFIELYENSDVMLSSYYDDAIVWMARAHWFSTKEDSEAQTIFSQQKAYEIISKLTKNKESASEKRIVGAISPILNAPLKYTKH